MADEGWLTRVSNESRISKDARSLLFRRMLMSQGYRITRGACSSEDECPVAIFCWKIRSYHQQTTRSSLHRHQQTTRSTPTDINKRHAQPPPTFASTTLKPPPTSAGDTRNPHRRPESADDHPHQTALHPQLASGTKQNWYVTPAPPQCMKALSSPPRIQCHVRPQPQPRACVAFVAS